MANCAISDKGSNKIIWFIKDCVKEGKNYIGSNIAIHGLKENGVDIKWTDDIVTEITVIVSQETPVDKTFDKGMSDLTDALVFNGEIVSTREDVNKVTRKRIRNKHSIDDELEIHRLGSTSQEFIDYDTFVKGLLAEAKTFKDTNFPK